MALIKVNIKEIINSTPTIKTLIIDLNNQNFEFQPGQWIDCYADIEGKREVAGYSITSSPAKQGFFDLAVKMSDNPVTRFIHEKAKPGDILFIDGGQGKIFFNRSMGQKLVLLAAGIGITPLMSITRYVNDTATDVETTLIYSASKLDELIFHEELLFYSNENPLFSYIPIISQESHNWNGRKGKINEKFLRLMKLDPNALFYICGPSNMISDVVEALKNLDVDESNMKYEYWW